MMKPRDPFQFPVLDPHKWLKSPKPRHELFDEINMEHPFRWLFSAIETTREVDIGLNPNSCRHSTVVLYCRPDSQFTNETFFAGVVEIEIWTRSSTLSSDTVCASSYLTNWRPGVVTIMHKYVQLDSLTSNLNATFHFFFPHTGRISTYGWIQFPLRVFYPKNKLGVQLNTRDLPTVRPVPLSALTELAAGWLQTALTEQWTCPSHSSWSCIRPCCWWG